MDFIEKLGSVNEKFESIYNEHTKLLNKSKRDQALSANEIDLLHKRCKELEETIIDLEKKSRDSIENVKKVHQFSLILICKDLKKKKNHLKRN